MLCIYEVKKLKLKSASDLLLFFIVSRPHKQLNFTDAYQVVSQKKIHDTTKSNNSNK